MTTNSTKIKEEDIMKITNAEAFKKLFKGLYATELWSWPEERFLEWLNSDYTGPALQEPPTNSSISSAIECLLHPQDADDSDMSKAIDTAVRAMRLLRDQEPRVLTLEEVKSSCGILIWLERSFCAGHETVVTPIEITGVGIGGISFYFGDEDFRAYGHPVYGWRCWTARPTEEQRKVTPWETGTANGKK